MFFDLQVDLSATISAKSCRTSQQIGLSGPSSSVTNVMFLRLILIQLSGECELCSLWEVNAFSLISLRFRFYKKNLIPKVPLTEQQFVTINVNDPIEKVAADYEATLREKFKMPSGVPSFDLLLLGVGPDGHTASLFPGHQLLTVTDKLIAHISDSPKPPPQRITMTFPLINNARFSIFAVSGAGKADIVKRIFVDKDNLPAGKVTAVEKVYWLLDQHSAGQVSQL